MSIKRQVLLFITMGLALFSIHTAYAARVYVSWEAPWYNTDGSTVYTYPVTTADGTTLPYLTGFWIRAGSCDTNGVLDIIYNERMVGDPNLTTASIIVNGLTTICVTVAAVTDLDEMSDQSVTAVLDCPVSTALTECSQ